jgi:hypothetical protein
MAGIVRIGANVDYIIGAIVCGQRRCGGHRNNGDDQHGNNQKHTKTFRFHESLSLVKWLNSSPANQHGPWSLFSYNSPFSMWKQNCRRQLRFSYRMFA